MADLYFGDMLLVKDEEMRAAGQDITFEEVNGCRYYRELVQGSAEWFKIRLGVMTASEMNMFFTPKLARSNTEKSRAHVYELLGQRISGTIDEGFVGDHMLRGYEDEIRAVALYRENFGPVTECGFCLTDVYGFPFGYSPDGLVGDDGLVECKSRLPKHQVRTILDHLGDEPDTDYPIPPEYMIQCQSGLMVTQRKWCDFLSYCGGLPMVRIRVFPDPDLQAAIAETGVLIENTIQKKHRAYLDAITDNPNAIPTEKTVIEEMQV